MKLGYECHLCRQREKFKQRFMQSHNAVQYFSRSDARNINLTLQRRLRILYRKHVTSDINLNKPLCSYQASLNNCKENSHTFAVSVTLPNLCHCQKAQHCQQTDFIFTAVTLTQHLSMYGFYFHLQLCKILEYLYTYNCSYCVKKKIAFSFLSPSLNVLSNWAKLSPGGSKSDVNGVMHSPSCQLQSCLICLCSPQHHLQGFQCAWKGFSDVLLLQSSAWMLFIHFSIKYAYNFLLSCRHITPDFYKRRIFLTNSIKPTTLLNAVHVLVLQFTSTGNFKCSCDPISMEKERGIGVFVAYELSKTYSDNLSSAVKEDLDLFFMGQNCCKAVLPFWQWKFQELDTYLTSPPQKDGETMSSLKLLKIYGLLLYYWLDKTLAFFS